MNVVFCQEAEDIYMNYSQMLTFDKVFSQPLIEAICPDVTYNEDGASGKVSFTANFENYQVFGFIDSGRVQLKSKRSSSAIYANEFVQRVANI